MSRQAQEENKTEKEAVKMIGEIRDYENPSEKEI